jgi:Neutral/alkaline non-lysosomal ceramidase, N-terminal
MRIGSSEVDITPTNLPAELAGYGYFRDRQAIVVEHALSATTLTFEDDSGNRAVLIGTDTHSVDADIMAKVSDLLTTKTDGELADTTILLNASHTHSSVGTHHLIGVGERHDTYVDTILVPNLADAIIASFDSATDGEIGIARIETEGLSYNRAGGKNLDRRVTAVRVDSEHQRIAGIHMPIHPVVYGGNSTVISTDFPGYARDALRRQANTSQELWLTGTAGDIDPFVNKTHKGNTSLEDVSALGETIGHRAADLYQEVKLGGGALRANQTMIEVPVNTAFELDPEREAEAYREARKLPKTQDLGPLLRWLKVAEPIVNGNTAPTIAVPVTIIAIGKMVFAGFGAEIYNETGRAIEQAHPDLDIVTTMVSNEHLGYIPPRHEYDADAYAARSSAFIFGRKPLTPDSETIFRTGVDKALTDLKSMS